MHLLVIKNSKGKYIIEYAGQILDDIELNDKSKYRMILDNAIKIYLTALLKEVVTLHIIVVVDAIENTVLKNIFGIHNFIICSGFLHRRKKAKTLLRRSRQKARQNRHFYC